MRLRIRRWAKKEFLDIDDDSTFFTVVRAILALEATLPYIRRDGRYVAPHWRSNPNREWRDNWSTNPNVNAYTGSRGSRINPPLPQR